MSKKRSVVKRRKKPSILIPIIIAGLVAFFFYTGSAKKAEEIIKPVQVPLAAKNLEEHDVITKEDILVKELPASSVPPNAITKPDDLLGKVINTKSALPTNSMFLKESVAELKDIPSRIGMMLDEGELGLTMRVDLEKSVANSLTDGIDVQVRFFTKQTPSGKAFEGVLEERIKVLAVRDSKGEDVSGPVYEEMTEEEKKEKRNTGRVPTIVVFEATDEQASYLLRAQQLGDINILAISEENEDELDEEGTITEGKEEIDKITKEEKDSKGEKDKEEQTNSEKIKDVKAMIKTIEKNTKDKKEAKRQKKLLEEMIKQLEKEPLKGHGEVFDGNKVKLFIDAMSHTLDSQFTEKGYYVTPDREIVVYDEELNELRYFENRERFERSKYVLQEMSEAELDQYFKEIKKLEEED